MSLENITLPSQTAAWVDRNTLRPNNYNPNKVLTDNLKLLTESIFTNGWTLPIVARPDGTIIDGFHRWTVAGPEWTYIPSLSDEIKAKYPDMAGKTLYEVLGGKVFRVIVAHENRSGDMIGTVTHNRARGTHQLEPMKAIIKELLQNGLSTKQISVQLGMKEEEIFRLSDFTREDFLKMMIKNHSYGPAQIVTKY